MEACERHAKSTEAYRFTVADEVYAAKLREICGPNGLGGPYPFCVKKRKPHQGGDWTFERSIQERNSAAGNIYRMGKKAVAAIKIINKTFLMVCPDAKWPSGWGEEDVVNTVEYNLALIDEKKKKRGIDLDNEDSASVAE